MVAELNEYWGLLTAALLFLFIGIKLGALWGRSRSDRFWKEQRVPEIVKQRLKTSRSVLGGQFSEQLAPYLPDFPFNPGECRFIGKPVDFLVFSGLDGGNVEEVIFVEVKSGRRKQLSKVERSLRDAINQRQVRWIQYDVPIDFSGTGEGPVTH